MQYAGFTVQFKHIVAYISLSRFLLKFQFSKIDYRFFFCRITVASGLLSDSVHFFLLHSVKWMGKKNTTTVRTGKRKATIFENHRVSIINIEGYKQTTSLYIICTCALCYGYLQWCRSPTKPLRLHFESMIRIPSPFFFFFRWFSEHQFYKKKKEPKIAFRIGSVSLLFVIK